MARLNDLYGLGGRRGNLRDEGIETLPLRRLVVLEPLHQPRGCACGEGVGGGEDEREG